MSIFSISLTVALTAIAVGAGEIIYALWARRQNYLIDRAFKIRARDPRLRRAMLLRLLNVRGK